MSRAKSVIFFSDCAKLRARAMRAGKALMAGLQVVPTITTCGCVKVRVGVNACVCMYMRVHICVCIGAGWAHHFNLSVQVCVCVCARVFVCVCVRVCVFTYQCVIFLPLCYGLNCPVFPWDLGGSQAM